MVPGGGPLGILSHQRAFASPALGWRRQDSATSTSERFSRLYSTPSNRVPAAIAMI
ncbi:MAG: hypothetical protein GPOALKHO_000315 [Sodalis sp.]|nr:MAG: hypothetical protein GPOALKHO_000315 [Sodalis sp.]